MAPRASKSHGWWALATSVALHLALAQMAVSAAGNGGAVQPRPIRDSWTGTTFDVDAVLEDRTADTAQGQNARPETSQAEPDAVPKRAKAEALTTPVEANPRRKTDITPEAQVDTPPPKSRDATDVAREAAQPATARQATAAGAADRPSDEASRDVATAPSAGTARSGSFGASGESSTERDLAKAFTRALPRATSSDTIWEKLAIGYSARVYARLETDAQGHVVATDAWLENDAAAPPPELVRLVRRGAGLLGTGQFALPQGVAAGTQLLCIDVLLTQGSRPDDFLSDAQDTVELGFDAPSPGHPGRAFFRKASGRTLEMRVAIVSGQVAERR